MGPVQTPPVGRSGDSYLALGKFGDDLQPAPDRLDVGTEAGNVHVGPLLQLGDGGLIHLQQLGQVALGQRTRPAKLVQRHFGEKLALHGVDAPPALRREVFGKLAERIASTHSNSSVYSTSHSMAALYS